MRAAMPLIVIDPGHGGTAALGGSSPLGVRGRRGTLEKEVTFQVAKRLARRLGERAVLTRRADVNLSLAPDVTVLSQARGD